MPKQPFDDPNEFVESLRNAPSPRKRQRSDMFDAPLDDVPVADSIRATRSEKSWAGNYIRHGFTWTPAQLAMIERIAEQENMSKNAAARWLMDEGIAEYVEGGARPVGKEREVRVEPELRDWNEALASSDDE